MQRKGKHRKVRRIARRAILAVATIAAVAGGLMLWAALAQSAHGATVPSSRVACAATEDSYLTDCHGHRLDYRHGGWYAQSTVASFNDGFATSKQDDCQQGFRQACQWLTATHTAPAMTLASYTRTLPRWLHWQYASRQARREVCGTWHHGRIVPGIYVYGGNGDTSALICANGKAETS